MGGGGDRHKAHLWVDEVVAGFSEASGCVMCVYYKTLLNETSGNQ